MMAAVLTMLLLANAFVGESFNVDTTSYTSLKGPKENSYFGYSIAATEVNGSIKIWSGAPRYSANEVANGTAKAGAVYQCDISQTINGSMTQSCKTVQLKNESDNKKNKTDGSTDENALPKDALKKCPFTDTKCNYKVRYPRFNKLWLNKQEYKVNYMGSQRYNTKITKEKCYPDLQKGARLTGPPLFTVHEGLIAMDSNGALNIAKKYKSKRIITRLMSESIDSKRGSAQCLRFCYNAYSILDLDLNDELRNDTETYTGEKRIARKPLRSLRVYLRYNGSLVRKLLYEYRGPVQIASKYWNFTELELRHDKDSSYQLIFQVQMHENRKKITCPPEYKLPCSCGATSDIVLTDIVVTNAGCKDEPDTSEAVESEQSIGMSLNIKIENDATSTMTTCGPLWQKNCGYAKEATGICYEKNSNASSPRVLQNPASKGCIRGQLDIVLLVDQSGSVNQCNFQKVKLWLRDIVRGFTIGPQEQDIAVVVYSDPEYTRTVIELGFDKYENSGKVKKHEMLNVLRNLPYEAGKTYTGIAFQHANEQLLGPHARPDAKKMVILLTDGATTKNDIDHLSQEVEITRSLNATILAVGVADYNEKELVNISGSSENFFPVKDFSQLQQVRDTLRRTVSHTNLEGSRGSESMQNCQMGFSLFNGKNSVLMGSPGCYNRAGNVFRYSKHQDVADDENFNISTNASINSMFEDNKTLNAAIEGSQTSPESFEIPTLKDLKNVLSGDILDSYFGYAVSSGEFFGSNKGQYTAASAPRYNTTGSIIIYKSEPEEHLAEQVIIQGLQLGEYFGATLCAADVNNDGYTDLFVGAPLHTAINPDEGRVYLYMGGASMSQLPDHILQGSGLAFSRFGLVITAVGDISLDGYEDIVISAPREENQMGVVYIFLGGKEGITKNYAQRISASSFDSKTPFHLFGKSVASGVDFDKNGYPDIMIGSPGTDEIVVLKTRPVVHIDAEFSVTTPMVDRKDEGCWRQNSTHPDDACISCSICFSYFGLSVPPGIEIKYSIMPDTKKSVSRVRFHKTGEKLLYGRMTLWSANHTDCINHTLHLKKQIKDMMTELTLDLKFDMEPYTVHKSENSSVSDTLTPVLDVHNQKVVRATTSFKTYCEDTSSCVADISILNSQPIDEEGNYVSVYELSEEKLVRLKLEIENSGPEEAHAVIVTIQYPTFLIYSSVAEAACLKVIDQDTDKSENGFYFLSFILSKTFMGLDEKCSGMLNFIATSQVKPQTHESISFYLASSTVSRDDNVIDNTKNIKVPIVYKASFVLNGISVPHEIAGMITNTTNLTETVGFTHQYMIINNGEYNIPKMQVSMEWPLCAKNKEGTYHFEYIGHSVCVKQQIKTECEEFADRDIFALQNNTSICKIAETLQLQTVCMSSSKVFQCPEINISITNLAVYEHLSITVEGSVDLIQFHNMTSPVSFTSMLTIDVANKQLFTFHSDQSFEESIITSVSPPKLKAEISIVRRVIPLPIWVYFVSAFLGILVLVIIIIICYWKGFFNSKYAQKKQEAEDDYLKTDEIKPLNQPTTS